MKAENLEELINKLTLDITQSELEMPSLEEEITLKQAVDQLGSLNSLMKRLEKRSNALKEKIRNSGEDLIEGENYYVEFKPRKELEITPTKMLKWLKEHDQINLIDAVMKTSISEVRKYLGDIICDSLGKSKNGNNRILLIRQKN